MSDTPNFNLPADAMARIAETQARYDAERKARFEKQIADALAATEVPPTRQVKETVTIRTAADASHEDVITAVTEVYEGFFAGSDEQIDWHAFFDRLERYGFCVETIDSPAARKVQRYVRRLRDEEQ